jgi:predicted peptidase
MHSAPEGTLPYRLYIPAEYDPQQRYPLILWLHGASGTGKDNAGQIAGDQLPGTRTWTTPEQQAEHPAWVLVPQTETSWASRTEAGPTPVLTMVLQVLDAVSAEFPIDQRRIYVLGQSMGGGGVWSLVSLHPERFAAAVLVCPVIYRAEDAPKAAGVPMWIFMGDKDSLVTGARSAVEALRRAGATPRYTEYAGAGHDIWTRVFKEPELTVWLMGQGR